MDAAVLAGCSTAELADAIGQTYGAEMAVRMTLVEFVAEYDRRQGWVEDGARSMAEWLVTSLGLAYRTAAEIVRVAKAVTVLPAMADAAADGRLGWDQLAPATKFATAETDAATAELAMGLSAAQLEQMARSRNAPTTEEAVTAHELRSLRWRPSCRRGHHGTTVSAFLPDGDGPAVIECLGHLASKAPKDPDSGLWEPFEARCADALVEVCSTRLADVADADRATVVVHVDASVLAGEIWGGADIDGGPTVSAETARRLACDCRWQLLADGPDGQAVGVGRMSQQPPRWMRRQLRRRDQGCRWCGRTRWLHAHHIAFWTRDRGLTDPNNIIMLCGYHHRFVHERQWTITGDPSGTITFTSPDGRQVFSRAGPPGLRDDVRARLFEQPAGQTG